MTRQIIAGIGCRRACPAQTIVAMLDRACDEAGCRPTVLAAPAFKANEHGLHIAASQLGLRLILVEAGALAAAQARCTTWSSRAFLATGFRSIAEGSALAAAGPGSRLILPRIGSGGVTCALAEAAAP